MAKKKKEVKEQLINTILLKNGDEENEEERAFLNVLTINEQEALANGSNDTEGYINEDL